jgi:hypothetical protein
LAARSSLRLFARIATLTLKLAVEMAALRADGLAFVLAAL